ncbi:unnamed protein product [Lupinus luteus]|uniref:Altered inheritance of mitochondria protein 32 n=1 Tax=Lupinus luteus TaxID=3873 RepID=A0AAV1XNC8_LUPLU
MASDSSTLHDAVNGFTRPEMNSANLAGTVDAYDRHIFICYKNHLSWPPRLEASDDDPLLKLVAARFKARKNEITVKTKITVCESREEAGFYDGDVLIFPQMIRYRGLDESNVESFFEDVLVNGKPWAAGVPKVMTGSNVFVCAHGSRDVRCGVCGPELIKKLNEEIGLRGLKDQVSVMACSHVGGHKYAGNVIVYSPGPDGNIMGHWYGYVTPNDVPELLDRHIAKGEIIQKLWRGQMGPSVKGEDDLKVSNGEVTRNGKNDHIEIHYLSNNKNVAGCCQDVNGGISCCIDEIFEQNKGNEESIEAQKKQGCKITRNRLVWREHDVLTAVGVLGAVAVVAVAYKLYRR